MIGVLCDPTSHEERRWSRELPSFLIPPLDLDGALREGSGFVRPRWPEMDQHGPSEAKRTSKMAPGSRLPGMVQSSFQRALQTVPERLRAHSEPHEEGPKKPIECFSMFWLFPFSLLAFSFFASDGLSSS